MQNYAMGVAFSTFSKNNSETKNVKMWVSMKFHTSCMFPIFSPELERISTRSSIKTLYSSVTLRKHMVILLL